MGTISRWVVPCYFAEENRKVNSIEFDLTTQLKMILKNEVWERKFEYGFSIGLKNTNPDDIKRSVVKVYPRFVDGQVNEKRIPELIEKECGKIPAHLKIKNYKDWSHRNGFVIIEVEYNSTLRNIPSRRDLKGPIPNYTMKFMESRDQHIAVLKEISSFFLATLNLTFPTQFAMQRDGNFVNDGFFLISSNRKTYAYEVATSAFMHGILIETSKRSLIETNLDGLASVWHHNMWALKRYLIAVESNQLSMDNLLDLIYALEGLFEKSASADFIKTMCLLSMCDTRKEARKMKNILDLAYKIRNDIAHGARSYDPYDKVNLEGQEITTQMIYWKMKGIVAGMIIKAISKLISNEDMKNLRFNSDDFINLAFKSKKLQ